MEKRFLTDRELAIIRGGLLGDMFIRKQAATPNLGMRCSPKNLPYLEWIRDELPILFVAKPRNFFTVLDGKRYELLAMDSRVHPDLHAIYSCLVINGRKTVTNKYLEQLTPLSLAVWHMDDGCLYRNGKYRYIKWSTYSFTFEEHILICDYFKQAWDIHWNIAIDKRKGRELYFLQLGKQQQVKALIDLMLPHIIPHFHRKTL